MKKREILEEVKAVYGHRKNIDQILSDLNKDFHLTYDYWAKKFLEKGYKENVKLSNALLEFAESRAYSADDMIHLARSSYDDHKQRELIQRAIDINNNGSESILYSNHSIAECLAWPDWRVVFDPKWANELFQIEIEKAVTVDNYLSLVRTINNKHYVIGDLNLAEELMEKAIQLANSYEDFKDIGSIYLRPFSAVDNNYVFNKDTTIYDEHLGSEFLKKAESLIKTFDEALDFAEHVCVFLHGEKSDCIESSYKKASVLVSTEEEKKQLVDSIYEYPKRYANQKAAWRNDLLKRLGLPRR